MPTSIEWVRNPDGTKGETWNPITGCTPISAGCKNCYAKRMARRLAGRYGYPEAPNHFDVTLHPDRLGQPFDWKKGRRVFVCSMSDLFHPLIPDEFILHVFDVMTNDWTCHHTFLVLTKRPQRMLDWITQNRECLFLPLLNVWLGVTAENQEQADKRIPILLQVPAAVRFVSVEPMLSHVDLTECCRLAPPLWDAKRYLTKDAFNLGLGWVIAGCETGPGARPMELEWARDLRDQCREAGTPYFFKKATGGGVPDDLMIREFPR